jgi:hypothetical protein
LSGTPTPPWQHTVVAYGVDPEGGGTYTYVSSTVGGHMAVDQLDEAVETKRLLAGAQVVPRVRLSEKPMKTRYNTKSRPHFEIVNWWTPPGNGGALSPGPAPLQLSHETAAPAPEPAAPAEHVPVAEIPPPAGRSSGKITVNGKPAGKSKVYVDLEKRRPDLSDDIPF